MSISQPSHEIYAINIPEVEQFQATFEYNFFVPDECVNATGGVPANVLSRSSSEIDAAFMQYSVTRVPRLIKLSWKCPVVNDVGNLTSEQSTSNHSFGTAGVQAGTLVLDNLSKIVSEDDFASNNFVSVQFNNAEIDDKAYEIVSGSLVQRSMSAGTPDYSPGAAIASLASSLPSSIGRSWLAGTYVSKALNASFLTPTPSNSSLNFGLASTKSLVDATTSYYDRHKNASANVQINARLMHNLVNRAITNPTSTQAADMVGLHRYSKQVQQSSNQHFSTAIAENDYKAFIPYISLQRSKTSLHVEKYSFELVGYVIDRVEILDDGTTKELSPIVIDGPTVSSTADFSVKFNANYRYDVRTIALITMPATDDDTGEIATVKYLISSRPSTAINISTLKLNNPPPPGDVDFIWNYEINKPMVTWAFPVTSERDIKQFQVFRRKSINDCFELMKVYNFDDSVVPFPNGETPDPSLVERLSSPATFWIDGEFDWKANTSESNSFIYAIACIDAHGMTSNYSAQFNVWYDPFANKIKKSLVSHTGAPKSYPNLYLQGTLFQNTINVFRKTQMLLFFNPQCYHFSDNNDRCTPLLQTNKTAGAYKLQFINMNNLKAASLDINVDDRLTQAKNTISSPSVTFGRKRKNSKNTQ